MEDLAKYYQVLGLEAEASAEEVKQAYRDLVKVWHPDRFMQDARLRLLAQEKLKAINGAYEMLRAHAFDAATKPAATATSPTPTEADSPTIPRRRATRGVMVGMLALLLLAAVGLFIHGRSRDKKATLLAAAIGVRPSNSVTTTNHGYALSFQPQHGGVAIATTGALTGTFTVECWVLTHQPKQVGTIISSGGPNDGSFDLKFRQGKRFHADIGDGSHWLWKLANTRYAYAPDTWYHLAYVVTSNRYCSYVNGQPTGAGELEAPGNPVLYDDRHHLYLGAEELGGDQLNGRLAEVRIWRTARSQAEIQAHFQQPLTGAEPGLQGYWRFAEGTGTFTADGSGHGFTGTLRGKVAWSSATPPNR